MGASRETIPHFSLYVLCKAQRCAAQLHGSSLHPSAARFSGRRGSHSNLGMLLAHNSPRDRHLLTYWFGNPSTCRRTSGRLEVWRDGAIAPAECRLRRERTSRPGELTSASFPHPRSDPMSRKRPLPFASLILCFIVFSPILRAAGYMYWIMRPSHASHGGSYHGSGACASCQCW